MEIEKSPEDIQAQNKFKNIVLNFAYNNFDGILNPFRKIILNILYDFEKNNKDA